MKSEDIEYLANLPMWHEVDQNIIMVHAGIVPGML